MRETLYVISSSPSSTQLVFVVLGAVLILLAIFAPRPLGHPKAAAPRTGLERSERVASLLAGSLFAVVGVLTWLDAKRMNAEVYQAYTDGKCQIAEGTVHLEHIQPEEGHAQGDVVKLGGQTFEIDYFHLAAGYQQTVRKGGVLREGASMRVWLCDGRVARIDRVPPTVPSEPGQSHETSP
ncbi:MAG: hypothetical protein R3B07_26325 [Polyangiaceae bacterium]